MDNPSAPLLHPAALPPGTQVGPWLVVALAGFGASGAVYRAVPVDNPLAPPVALKLALRPGDSRFAREVELLSLLRHPHIPLLVDHGSWQPPGGAPHPFFVMQWVEGSPLYDWALLHPPSPTQVLRLLAQLARALEALHSLGAVHRDVKGGNVLVRHSDGHVLLTDFGTGRPADTLTLTAPGAFPGTPLYLSPESALFELQSLRHPSARYSSRPADDVYALGVTACRLLTGLYPELGAPSQDKHGTWYLSALVLPPTLQQVAEPLRSLVLRMLSLRPEQRGSAAQLAHALEAAAQAPSPASTQPFAPPPRRPLWLTVAACLGLGAVAAAPLLSQHVPHLACAESSPLATPGTGTQGLGHAATTSQGPAPQGVPPQSLAEDALPEPLPGQIRADSKGRCPHKKQLALNGGCWLLLDVDVDEEACSTAGGYLVKKACYVPFFSHPPSRPPTSHPAREP